MVWRVQPSVIQVRNSPCWKQSGCMVLAARSTSWQPTWAQCLFGAAAMRFLTIWMDTCRNELNVDPVCVAKSAGGAVFVSTLIFVILSSKNALKFSASRASSFEGVESSSLFCIRISRSFQSFLDDTAFHMWFSQYDCSFSRKNARCSFILEMYANLSAGRPDFPYILSSRRAVRFNVRHSSSNQCQDVRCFRCLTYRGACL